MILNYIDSHVNLHAPQFDADRLDVINRARSAGVGLMLNICDRLSNLEAVYSLTQEPDIWATAGTHPHEAKEDPDLTPEAIMAAAQKPKIVGIGECGLDYHYDYSPRPVQQAVFRAHIKAARALNLPLVVHTREADEDMWGLLYEAYQEAPFRFLLHCYTSGLDLLLKARDIGAYFSVSGIASFKAAQDVRDLIQHMPDDRILIETDCPYLAPIPMRGRRNEPAFVPYVYKCLAETKGWSLETTQMRTHKAFFELFDKIPAPQR